MKRHTIRITDLRDKFNRMLACPGISQDGKQILCSLLEEVLMESENYAGFSHLYDHETKPFDRNYFA